MNLNEDTLSEQPVLEIFKNLGYDYAYGPDIAPGGAFMERSSFREVILSNRLRGAIRRINPDASEQSIETAVEKIVKYEHPSLEICNKAIFEMIVQGVKVNEKDRNGKEEGKLVKIFDFENVLNNEFLVVNQFTIQGMEKIRRPDVVIFINGIPIAVFELKSPTSNQGTIFSAFQQLQEYKKDIPDLFKYNQMLVISDLLEAKHGTITSSWERFSVWKKIESENERKREVSELETLTEGIFHRARLMDIIENFIIFESDSEKNSLTVAKKMCLYHQYFGVNKAVEETKRAMSPGGDKKIGVFWHTQGSGKSLSMVFYANKTKKIEALQSPAFVFLTDRNDLDGQLYKTFKRSGYPYAKRATSVKNLKEQLKSTGGELIFTTIQKFETREEKLSSKENIIVISDEAHRSQYANYANNVRSSLPNASFMGITGTPISLNNRDTRLVFGDYISEYKINQAVTDGATVPIYYESRLAPLRLNNYFIDEEYEVIMGEEEFEYKENYKRKFARLEEAVGSQERLKKVAKDIVDHYNGRGLTGKAMIVTISRRVAVELYKIIIKNPEAPQVAVVVSKPEDFKGVIQKETESKELERKFKDPEDPLKIAIVCDMWLTGFDVPSLHTMYLDKPLKNHTLMQAIARVNRVYKDKPGGLIVDYIGIANDLKKALSVYSLNIQKEAMIPLESAIEKMREKYDIVKNMFSGVDFDNWKNLKDLERSRLFQQAINFIITNPKTGLIDEGRKKDFFKESEILFKLFALVMPHHEAGLIRSEVEFFQAIKRSLKRNTIVGSIGLKDGVESTIRDLISKSIEAEKVVNIFEMEGKGEIEVSIFNEKFLEEVANMRYRNIAVEVLKKLLNDEIRVRMRKNIIRYKTLQELLEKIIKEYETNIKNSARTLQDLIELAKEIKKTEKDTCVSGLNEEEVAFFDIMSSHKDESAPDLKDFSKEIVKSIKKSLTVDWTNNEIIKPRIRANLSLLLLQKGFSSKKLPKILENIMQQATLLYRDYSPK